ncbi:probable lipid-A-disaccharide synthase, mitochondrial isoform X2 [Brachypodium distachyon]|uniref:probable lipid-A-disaccharide synthase, mitochondrial isoform X2 n=1 Tax=Brachypodium distachyon TaxID=15368 RepID=UPI00052FE8E6|nr:probable lipid-A-disaccharide synthase, mitochondrial isoform X2 [Brachypodium distachyon]|eukprot:XP_010232323.1 probable lipid-A-disaccharide synthase, mitochondrial isoform X2 [Brachypodium distachyon]
MGRSRRASARAAGQAARARLFLREGVRRGIPGRRASAVRCRRELMCKEGLQSLFPMEEIAIMGLWELLPHIYNVKRKIENTVDAAMLFQPHAVVTIDSKGFSFCLLQQLKCRYNQKVDSPLHVHYVAPSFWAWKGGESRLSKLHNFVDHMLCILPFEHEICRLNGLPATYVGHPLLDDAAVLKVDPELSSDKSMHQESGEAFRLEHKLSPDATILTMLPGSRMQEVARMLPIFLRTVQHLSHTLNELSLVIPVAPHRDVRNYVENVVRSVPFPVVLIPGGSLEKRYGAFNASKAALCTSGTAVMELMLAKLPCVVAYQAHFITECFIHLRKKINFISLPNILLNSPIVPEILFRACTDKNLAAELSEVIFNDEVRQRQVGSADRMLQVLYEPIKQRGGSFVDEVRSLSSSVHSPSTIAALTVLYTDKS